MCTYIGYGEFAVEAGVDFPKARKPHWCNECSRAIRVGERYRRCVVFFDGYARTDRCCAHCEVLRFWVNHECGSWLYGGAVDALADPDEPGDHQDETSRALVAGSRAEWTLPDGTLMPVPVPPQGELRMFDLADARRRASSPVAGGTT